MHADPKYEAFSIFTDGAHFAEVGVDRHTGEIRLRRMPGVFAAGRVLNAKTARSQLIGGMAFGVSHALNEEGVKRLGELGVCGAGASVANAVFNAKRPRR